MLICLLFSLDSFLKTKSVSAEMLHIIQLAAVSVIVNILKDGWNKTMEYVTEIGKKQFILYLLGREFSFNLKWQEMLKNIGRVLSVSL